MDKEEAVKMAKECISRKVCTNCEFKSLSDDGIDCNTILAKYIIDKENEPAPSANDTSSKSENKNILPINNSTESIICQALKLAKIAAEAGAEITYSDGVFVIKPKLRGDNNAIFD